MLERAGYTVAIAGNGAAAIEGARDPSISLILMDIDLGAGRMTGTEAAEQILAERTLPIVFLSSHAERAVVDQVKHITRYGYVLKSAGEFVLLEAISMAFELFAAHEAMRRRNRFIETILDNIPIGLAVNYIDDGNAVYMNRSFQEIYGWPKEAMTNIPEFFERCYPDPEYRREITAMVMGDIATGNPDKMAWNGIRVTRSDGSTALVDAKSIPIDEQNFMISTVQDVTERTRAQQLFETIVRTSPDGVILVERDGTILEVNEAYCRLIGYDREELVGMSLSLVESEENPEELQDHIASVISHGHDRFATRHRRKDGTPVPLEIVTTFFSEFGGRFVSFVRDISERLEYESHLEQRDRMLEDISTNAPGMVYQFRIDREGRLSFPFIGKAVERDFGVSLPAIREDPMVLIDSVYPEDLDRLEQGLMESSRTLSQYRVVLRFVDATGGIHWLDARATPRRLDDGSTLWTGIAVDVTREHNLAESYRAIYDHIHAGIVEATPDGTIRYANPFFCRFLGYAESEIIGRNILDVTHEEDRNREQHEIWVPTLGGQAEGSALEKRYVTRDGTSVWARVNTSVIRNEFGEIVAAIGLVSDIGKERDELQALIREREQRDVFLREINHRTKNNLTLIASLIRLKQRNLDGVDLSDVIHRIEAIQVVYEKLHLLGSVTEVNVRDYVVDLVRRIFASMSARPVRVVEEIDSIALGVGDAIPVGLIINEIATNAVKYGFPEVEDPTFTIRFSHDPERWRLILSNNGRPIPEDVDLERPTSMGFRIITSLVGQLHGTIALRRRPQTSFEIECPR